MVVDVIISETALGAPIDVTVGDTIDVIVGADGLTGPRAPQELVIPVQGGTTATDASQPIFTYVGGPTPRKFDPTLLRGHCDTAAAADALFPVTLNGVALGDVKFAAGASSPVATFSTFTISLGQVFRLFGPATPDASLLNPTIILVEATS